MTISEKEAQKILFTDEQGNEGIFADVVAEGLEGAFSDRVPGLIEIMKSGTPRHRLLACATLVSWGHPAGFETALQWVSNPEKTPWHDKPVICDRLYSEDSAFEIIAGALQTNNLIEKEKNAAVKNKIYSALLHLFHKHYFGRTLAAAIGTDEVRLRHLEKEIISALKTSIKEIKKRMKNNSLKTYMPVQTCCLLGCLAPINDPQCAEFAHMLIDIFHSDRPVLCELLDALADGKGKATLVCIHRIKSIDGNLETELKNALSKRNGLP